MEQSCQSVTANRREQFLFVVFVVLVFVRCSLILDVKYKIIEWRGRRRGRGHAFRGLGTRNCYKSAHRTAIKVKDHMTKDKDTKGKMCIFATPFQFLFSKHIWRSTCRFKGWYPCEQRGYRQRWICNIGTIHDNQ